MIENIKRLCNLCGTSGREEEVREEIISQIKDFCDYRVDPLGNIIAFKKGKKTPKKRIMLDAHMDEVGFIATHISGDGFIKFAPIGGINTECILSERVLFEDGTLGVIDCKPVHLLSAEARKKLPDVNTLHIDIGIKPNDEKEEFIYVGDTATFAPNFETQGDIIISKAIDDRAGVAILIELIKSESEYDFHATFTVQEEVGCRGAAVAAYSVEPDYCICLEATTASDIEGVEGGSRVCKMGDGPVISFMDRGTLYDRELFQMANALPIKHQVKTAVAGGNNSSAIHKSRSGVRTLALSIPCRYIHSASSMASMSDINDSLSMAKSLISLLGGQEND